jgi:hypothetical protein
MADGARMVFLGFGKYVRADKIYALEPIVGEDRGGGRRTKVWIEGIPEAIVASRTERTILLDMGVKADAVGPVLSEALALAEHLVEQTESGRVDLNDLSRRARRVLSATTASSEESEQLF